MARRRTTTSSSSRKTGGSTRKSGTTRKTASSSRKTASSRKTTSARKTSTGRKKSGTTRKKSGTSRKTASSRKTSSSRKATTSRKSGGATRKTAASRKSTSGRKTSTSRKSGGAKKSTAARRQQTKTLGSLRDVFEEELADLYSAEQQLVQALPKVAGAAGKPELREAVQNHLEETRGHVRRLEQIFRSIGMRTPNETCEGMQGLLEEGEEIISARGDASAKDAALIGAAQRVEHYEIAAYGTARTLAGELGLDDARDLLNETLDEESRTDELLTRIATGGMFGTGVNQEAASG